MDMSEETRDFLGISRAEVAEIVDAAQEMDGKERQLFKDIRRSDILPDMFKIRGVPYSLQDYPQFRALYDQDFVQKIIFLCGRQISKSTNLSRSEVLEGISIPHFQILYVAPLQQQTQRYSNLYLSEAISSCPFARSMQSNDRELGESKIVKAVHHQSFANGSGIQLTYAKTSPDRARGITSDMVDFDEVQDQLADNIPIITESLSNSEWGIQRFTGTAKTTDNVIQYLFNQSTMSEWAMRCNSCGHWNIPTQENNVLDMIHVKGTVCVKCRKKGLIRPLDLHAGMWLHASPKLENEFLGLHIPQIVVPALVYDPSRWVRVINKVLKLPPSIILTEVLGISSDTGVRLISQSDIDAVSDLGSHEELQHVSNKYAYRVLGIDWGISEITSYTVATVVGVTHNGNYHVLFGKRYVGMDPEEVIHDIVRMARAYKADYLAPDFGVGFTNNALLRNRDMQVVQIQYVTQNRFLNYGELHGIPRWMVDRNTALSCTFYAIRNDRVHFPNVEQSKEYTVDLLSPYESQTEVSSGIVKKHFLRDPNRPDDFCHALTFAMMVLMHLTDDDLLTLKPESAGDYAGREFPEEGTPYDVVSQLNQV
jgi:hypothetical protein